MSVGGGAAGGGANGANGAAGGEEEVSCGGARAAPAALWLSELEEDAYEKYVWHFDMLHHDARHEAFEDAFRRLPATPPAGSSTADGALALDLGCGSGLLGLMLRKHAPGGVSLRVLAVEADPVLARVAADNARRAAEAAREAAACVQGAGEVSVRACASTRLRPLPAGARAALAVSELLDSALLGEGVLPTLRHAAGAGALLERGYRAIPARAQVKGVVVESPYLRCSQRLTPEGRRGLPRPPPGWRRDAGDERPHEVNLWRLEEAGRARRLTREFYALTIDFEHLPPSAGQEATAELTVEQAGVADAVVFWWRCAMLRGDAWDHQPPGLTNAPAAARDLDHWRQAACMLSLGSGRRVQRGQRLRVHAMHDDELVWFQAEVGGRARGATASRPRRRRPSASSLRELSPWRLRMFNEPDRLEWFRRAAAGGLALARARTAAAPREAPPEATPEGPLVVDLSDGGLLALFCRAQGRRAPLRKRSAALFSRRLRRRLRQLGRERPHSPRAAGRHGRPAPAPVAPARAPAHAPARLEAIGPRRGRRLCREFLEAAPATSQRECATLPTVSCRPRSWRPAPGSVDLLLAEPYDGSIEQRECDLQLWQHWAQVQDLRPTLSARAVAWPRNFRLRAALVSCASLWRRRRPLEGVAVGGVNVGCMDRLASPRHFPWAADRPGAGGAGGQPAGRGRTRFPCELWQQTHTLLPGQDGAVGVVLAEVDVLQQELAPMALAGCRLPLPAAAGRLGVHALATWTEVAASSTGFAGEGAAAAAAHDAAWLSTAAFEPYGGCGEVRRFAPGAFKQGVLLAANPWHGDAEATEEAPSPKRPRTGPPPAAAPPAFVDVRAHFDPARGELRLDARWEDGRLF